MFPVSNLFAAWSRRAGFMLGLFLTQMNTYGETSLSASDTESSARPAAVEQWYLREYRVDGVKKLRPVEIEGAVYRYLGPKRTRADVELARASIEALYQNAGYQTVAVLVPEQDFAKGIVHLQVVEGTVGRVRVTGAKYSSPKRIKRTAKALREGEVINFNDVPKDVAALNRLPGRQITPSLKAGEEPGSVDIDLTVKEKFPVGGSLEVNNRRSPDTTALRVNGSVTLNNLGQSGDTASLSFQVAPESPKEVKVFSAVYVHRPRSFENLTLILQATKQDSNVSTLGGTAVNGRGTSGGVKALWSLPGTAHFVQSISLGLDYKYSKQKIQLGADAAGATETPITILPLTLGYASTWFHEKGTTEMNASASFHLRGFGSDVAALNKSRFNTDGAFFYVRGDITHTHELPWGLQISGKLQGQLADRPLLTNEQFTGGGVGTARGYLEGQAAGDNGGFASLEFRSPNLAPYFAGKDDEWRFYVFNEGGFITLNEPLPEQKALYYLASYGFGSSFTFANHWTGSLDYSVPMLTLASVKARQSRLNFRAGLEF